MPLSDPKVTPKLPHFYFLLQSIINQGPFALLNFSNADLLYLIENAQIPQVQKLERKVAPEVKAFADTWNLLLGFWASFLKEKNPRENLQRLLQDLIRLSALFNISFLLKSKQDFELFNVRAPSETYIALLGHRKVVPEAVGRPEISPEMREKLPNFLKVSVVGAKLAPILFSLFSYSVHEKSTLPPTVDETPVVHWPSLQSSEEYIPTAVTAPSLVSEQVEAVLHEAEEFRPLSQTAGMKSSLKQKAPLSQVESIKQLRSVLNEIDQETRKELDLFLQLIKGLLEGLIAPVPVLVEKIPRELINPMISMSGLLEDIGGQSYRNVSTSFVNWLISLVAYLQDEPILSDSEWEDHGRALLDDVKTFSGEFIEFSNDAWIQSWIKRFTDHFTRLKDVLASRAPPVPPSTQVFKTANLYTVIITLKEWGEFLFFKLPQYLGNLSWQFPVILFPHWFKESVKGPYPRIEFKQKNVEGWVDEIKSIKGAWSLALQAIARVYPKEDPFVSAQDVGPWTPGLRRTPLPSTHVEPISRWFVYLDAPRLVIKDTRYFFKYKSRWLTLGIKKKSYADSGRLDVEIGREIKSLAKGHGISIKLELGVPAILGAPLLAQKSPFSGVTLTGIRVTINRMRLVVRSERHPRIYQMILPFATSAIKRRIETLIEDEAIKMING